METKLEVDRIITRRFDQTTGKEHHPYIEVKFMQDRVNFHPGDMVRVTVEVIKRARRSKP